MSVPVCLYLSANDDVFLEIPACRRALDRAMTTRVLR